MPAPGWSATASSPEPGSRSTATPARSEGYTVSGRWHYLEYDFYSTAGSYIHEPAGSVHTLDVPSDNTELTEILFIIEGVCSTWPKMVRWRVFRTVRGPWPPTRPSPSTKGSTAPPGSSSVELAADTGPGRVAGADADRAHRTTARPDLLRR